MQIVRKMIIHSNDCFLIFVKTFDIISAHIFRLNSLIFLIMATLRRYFYVTTIVLLTYFLNALVQIIGSYTLYKRQIPAAKLSLTTFSNTILLPSMHINVIITKESGKIMSSFLEKLATHPLIKDGTLKIKIISCSEDETETFFPIYNAPCSLTSDDSESCLYYYSLKDFSNEATNANWLFQVYDTTWVDLSNLNSYIEKLTSIYDPVKNIVFRGNSIVENGESSIGFSAGTVMSRALVNELLSDYQDLPRSENFLDIVNKTVFDMYNRSELFDDFYILYGSCLNCDSRLIEESSWVNLPDCDQSKKLGKTNEIISMDVKSSSDMNFYLSKSLKNIPNHVFFYNNIKKPEFYLCFSDEIKKYVSLTPNELRAKKTLIYPKRTRHI